MRSNLFKLVYAAPALALITGALVFDFASYARAADASLSETQKAEVRQLIKDYVRENPDLLVESLKAFQIKQQQDQLENSRLRIKDMMKDLTASDAPSAGNPKGDVTVVEFYDYNCGYCKKALPDVQHVLEADKNVRFVFFDMPILGPSSFTAAQWAHAAHRQGKYFEFHVALMEHHGAIEDSVLEDISKKLGLDVEKMKKDAESESVANDIKHSMEMGGMVGIQGTPAFIVGDQFYPGYLGEEGLKGAIEKVRKEKSGDDKKDEKAENKKAD